MAMKKKKASAGKTLMELVEAKAGESSLSGKNRAVLMDMRSEIEEVLARGYKWRVVWQVLRETGRIDMGYDTFRMHCRAMGLDIAPQSYTKEKEPVKPRKKRKKKN